MIWIVWLGLITFQEEDPIASRRLSYPGNIYFATLDFFGISLLLLTTHADMIFKKGLEIPDPVDEMQTVEDHMNNNDEHDQAEAISMEGISS